MSGRADVHHWTPEQDAALLDLIAERTEEPRWHLIAPILSERVGVEIPRNIVVNRWDALVLEAEEACNRMTRLVALRQAVQAREATLAKGPPLTYTELASAAA